MWDETGEIPGEDELTARCKYGGLHSQSSQNVLDDVQQVRAVWNSGKQRWELHVVCKREITAESPGENVAGVDLGICNPAVVAFPDDALLYSGNRLREDKHYFQREAYQTEGNHGPSKKAQWAREKLSRRKDHFLYALSKDIVGRCLEHDVGTLVVVTRAV